MALDIGDALREGFDRLLARNGLFLVVIFAGFGLLNAVVQQSLNRVQFEGVFDSGDFERLFAELPITATEFAEFVERSTPLAYLDSLGLAALVGLAIALAIVAETLRIVAVRTFVSDETAGIPPELRSRRLGWAVLHGIVGGIVAGLLVVVGLIFFVLPGLFLAVAFAFVRQEIAVEDAGPLEALGNSWSLTAGHRLRLFGLLAVLVLILVATSILFGLFGAGAPAVGAAIDAIGGSVVLAYSVAVVSRAYAQLVDDREAQADEFEGIDPELLP